jgi:hypothetical protein
LIIELRLGDSLMKRVGFVCAVLVFAVAMVVGLCALSGCDEGTGRALTVTPETVRLAGATTNAAPTNTVMLAVETNSLRSLSLPITWKVTNPALGSVVANDGATAQYSRTPARGINVVTASDQYGAEGFCTVNQE